MTLTSNALRIDEDPMSASRRPLELATIQGKSIGPVQLKAIGNVKIEGRSLKQGLFTATANSASYDQVKELFILEGDGRVPATIWRTDARTGADESERRPQNYVQPPHRFAELEGVRSLEFTPGGAAVGGDSLENAFGPAPFRQ